MSKLTFRIIALTLLIFVVGIFLVAALLTRDELAQESQTILDQGIVFAELTAPSLYQSYLTATAQGALNFADALTAQLSKNPNVSGVMMIGLNGKVIFDSQDIARGLNPGRTATGSDRYITDAATLAMVKSDQASHRNYTEQNQQFTEIIVPINETTGSHALSMRYQVSYAALQNRTREISVRVLGWSSPLLLLAALLSLGLAFSITRPLKNMAEIAQLIGRGTFTASAPSDAPGELGVLATSLNSMSVELKASREKDAHHREELKSRVAELEAAKSKLETSLEELSRFYKVTVEREIKMKELKEQNENLTKELGMHPSNPPPPAVPPAPVLQQPQSITPDDTTRQQ